MKKPETVFKEKVMPQVNQIPGVFCFKTNMVAFAGIPDLFIITKGLLIVWELKFDPSEAPSGRQSWFMRKLKRAGCKCRIVHPGNFKRYLQEVKRLASQ